MTFNAPWMLVVTGILVPVMVFLYFWLLKRKREGLIFSNLSLVKEALGKTSKIKSHIPAIFFLLGTICLLIASSRPETSLRLPFDVKTVYLLVDISGSMKAMDVKPSRMEAEKEALKEYVKNESNSTEIGLISFSKNAFLVQKPTNDKDLLYSAINKLEPFRETSIGDAIILGVCQIYAPTPCDEVQNRTIGRKRGSYSSAILILMTDGSNTYGTDPVEAAHVAADKGIRVYTIGYGSGDAEVEIDGIQMQVSFDEEPLKEIADITDATYQRAKDNASIHGVYRNLSSKMIMQRQKIEISSLFCAGGALFMIISFVLAMFWF